MSTNDLAHDYQYSEQKFREMAEALGLDALSPELRRKIEHSAREYVFMAEFDEDRATRKQRRKALKELAAAADNLKLILDELGRTLIEGLNLPKAIAPGDLDQLADAARRVADQVPLTGGDPAIGRLYLVRGLGHIFTEATGKRPTLRRNKHHEPHGPFYEFVEAALAPLNKHATQGLETDVRVVVGEMRKLDAESRSN